MNPPIHDSLRLLVMVECARPAFDDAIDALRERMPGARFSFLIRRDRMPWTERHGPERIFVVDDTWKPDRPEGQSLLAELAAAKFDACAIAIDGLGVDALRYRYLALRLRPRRGTWIASGSKVGEARGRIGLACGLAALLGLRQLRLLRRAVEIYRLPLALARRLRIPLPQLASLQPARIATNVRRVGAAMAEGLALPVLLALSIVARYSRRKIDIGLGPDPLINNIYHKQALERQGYSAETFVRCVWFITSEFDVRGDRMAPSERWIPYYLFAFAIFRYRCIYIYFHGGPLAYSYLWRLEPWLLRIARTYVVVMPYGGDIYDMLRAPNLPMRHAMAMDYPRHRLERVKIDRRIDLWSTRASHIIAGCDWVDYLFHWDRLMLAHFSIDTERWRPPVDARLESTASAGRPLRVLHAPNHRTLKGTKHFIQAVEELKAEGVPVELVIVERQPNDEVRRVMATVDVVADQLIIGWYAMFALEAMSMEKPVLCYLREDLEELYIGAGLIRRGEIPIIKCSPATVKEAIRRLAVERDSLSEIGRRSREYVMRHHSLDAVGKVFRAVNSSLGISPSVVAATEGPHAPSPARNHVLCEASS